MQDVPAPFNINLRTGFFKTEPYTVSVSREALTFTRAGGIEGAEQFMISCRDVQSVVILGSFPAELEIRTEKGVFTGTFQKPADMDAAAAALRAVFGKRFLKESFA
ncbi:MAG: hypothetical protein AB1374_09085 [Bacillota bacterium]